MSNRPPTIDMTPEGQFRPAPRPPGVPLSFKLLVGGVIVAVLAGAAAVAALAVTLVSMLLPVIVIAAVVAWASFKYRQWRARGTALRR